MKLFDLLIQDAVVIRQRPMSFIKKMEATYKRQIQYKGCTFAIRYNSTIK